MSGLEIIILAGLGILILLLWSVIYGLKQRVALLTDVLNQTKEERDTVTNQVNSKIEQVVAVDLETINVEFTLVGKKKPMKRAFRDECTIDKYGRLTTTSARDKLTEFLNTPTLAFTDGDRPSSFATTNVMLVPRGDVKSYTIKYDYKEDNTSIFIKKVNTGRWIELPYDNWRTVDEVEIGDF